jgi:hypothetical protein
MRATHNQYEDYAAEPQTDQERIQKDNSDEYHANYPGPAARARQLAQDPSAPPLPVFHQPTRTQTIPAPAAASKLSPMQLRAQRQRAQTAPRPAPQPTPAPAPEYHEPARCTAPGCRRLAVVDEGAAPHCGAHRPEPPAAVEAARKSESERKYGPAELSELDRAIEALIRTHHLGPVLDAAWSASARVSPWKSRGQTA